MIKDKGHTAETNREPAEVGPSFPQDHHYAQRLIAQDEQAWEYFSNEFRKKIKDYIEKKYLNILGDIAIEEIYDGVVKRLMMNDHRAIRKYRGECAFSTYITQATDWEIKDWLRKNATRLLTDPLEPSNETLSSSAHVYSDEHHLELPEAIKGLSDELRWAFLLRYYDDFDFPIDEIRLLAKKQGVSIWVITERIVKYLEPQGGDILAEQRNKRRAFYRQLQKIWSHIQESYIKEHRLMDAHAADDPAQPEKLHEIRAGRSALESKRDKVLKKKGKISITTPYEIIAIILGEENVSTIRSRVFLAKKQLTDKIQK